MYIAPNSTVLVLRGVNIDSEYNHTVRFVNTTAQYDTLSAKVKYTFTPTSYQRTNRGTIRVERIADDLFDCNYLMFQNTSYGSKWFYAFLDKVNYINDKCSELEYTIDVIQSFMFDFEVGECFVEREHSITDNIGENTVSEKFNLGDYFINKEIKKVSEIFDDEMYGAIIFSKPISALYQITPQQKICDLVPIEAMEGIHSNDDDTIGVPNSLTIATGFCVGSEKPVDNDYYQQVTPNSTVASITKILNLLRRGLLGDQSVHEISAESIVAAYIYPKEFSNKTKCDAAQRLNYPVGYCVDNYVAVDSEMPTTFPAKDNSTNYDFANVKNKKLLTAPYIRLKFFSQGNSKTYNYENFTGLSGHANSGIKLPQFYLYGNKIGGAEFDIQARNYQGTAGENRNETIQFTENPIALYSGNAYASYMERNANSYALGMLSSVLGMASAGIVSKLTSNPIPLISGVVSGFTSIAQKMGQIEDLHNTPPSSNYATNLPLFAIGSKFVGGIFYGESVNAETARIIDDYFNMYGYATNRVKEPNIFKYFKNTSGYYLRPHWNYVKTSGAIIHPINFYGLVRGLPAEAEKQIAQIIDKGITFWNDESEIGNYSLSNAATGVPNG